MSYKNKPKKQHKIRARKTPKLIEKEPKKIAKHAKPKKRTFETRKNRSFNIPGLNSYKHS